MALPLKSPSSSAPDSAERRRMQALPSVSATQLVSGMNKVTSTVMTHGAVVVTRHEQPAMVLMSIERYLALENAAEPDLDQLTHRFDEMFDRMQGDAAAQRMADAFAMAPEALGAAALQAAAGDVPAR
jgi:PHD/YefM family antitoxin component YafN of YafNO toxin-antitoxin module